MLYTIMRPFKHTARRLKLRVVQWRFFTPCMKILAALVVSFAILITAARLLTPVVAQYREPIQTHLSQLLGKTVTIDSMESRWYWLEPVLKLNQVRITDTEGHTIHFHHLLFGIDILHSLFTLQLQPGTLYADGTHLTLKQIPNGWNVNGFLIDTSVEPNADWVTLLGIQHRLIAKDLSVNIHLLSGRHITFHDFRLKMANQHGQIRMKSLGLVNTTHPTKIRTLATLKINPTHIWQTEGNIYIELDALAPGAWQEFMPPLPVQIRQGLGDIQLWIDINQGAIQSAQSHLQFHHLAWRENTKAPLHLVETLQGNLGFKVTKTGWLFRADKIELTADNFIWPKNAFSVEYTTSNNTYHANVEHVLLEALSLWNTSWLKPLDPLWKLHPLGLIHSFSITFSPEQGLSTLLFKMDNVGLKGNNAFPAIAGISGVLYASPESGKLMLDSSNLMLKSTHMAPLIFKRLNTDLEWKTLSHGLRLHLLRFVLINPETTVTASGILDNPMQSELRTIHLNLKYALKNAEHWIALLPAESLQLKPKLDAWLKNNIKQIATATGEMNLQGVLADFPFEQGNGTFNITTYLNDLSLIPAPHWPLAEHIDGVLTINGRDLEATLQHAAVSPLTLDNLSLRIRDIGHDHEILDIETHAEAPAEDIKNYILQTPLKKKLKRLRDLTFSELLRLRVNFHIPLYPENNQVASNGLISFEHNTVKLPPEFGDLLFKDINGTLAFHEGGFHQSTLTATLAHYPVSLFLQTLKTPNPKTLIGIHAKPTVSQLERQFHFPLSMLMEGTLHLNAQLTIANTPQSTDDFQVTLSNPAVKSEHLVLTRRENDAWGIDIEQKNINADLLYGTKTQTLNGTIKQLYLSKTALAKLHGGKSFTPNRLPHVNLNINELRYDDILLGGGNIQGAPEENCWTLSNAVLQTPYSTLHATGAWIAEKQSQHTTYNMQLSIKNLSEFLKQWHYSPPIEAAHGEINLSSSWAGTPGAYSLQAMQGDLSIALKEGRITQLSPDTEKKIQFGKLFSILSLQTIPRRLKLDFSDLSKSGYTFDSFESEFHIQNGLLNIKKSFINGPVAHATIKGELNLIKHDYDLELFISPHVIASLPVVATIAGGPIAGVATWVASKIINSGVQQVSGYTYKITGPWNAPVVQQVRIYKMRRRS